MTDPTFWQQFGPWCALAILLLAAIGFGLKGLGAVIMTIYVRMADALDAMHLAHVQQHKDHATELKNMHERQCVVTENNTKAMVIVSERVDRIEDKIGLCSECKKEMS